jgi:hypothetical protein
VPASTVLHAMLRGACSLALCAGLFQGATVLYRHTLGRTVTPVRTVAAPVAVATAVQGTSSGDHVVPPPPPLPAKFRVGALRAGSGGHYCTASVVDSPRRNLLITAAHCIHTGPGGGYLGPLFFSPGDATGHGTAAGVWQVRSELVDRAWSVDGDPDADVAFLTLRPRAGRDIEDVVGANPVSFDWKAGTIALIGYPDTASQALRCSGRARRLSDHQMRVYCPGFTSGTSGTPWLAGPGAMAGTGTLVGVLGGYRRGGSTADVSYSSVLDTTIAALYRRAVVLP